jgi:hypothetical protein
MRFRASFFLNLRQQLGQFAGLSFGLFGAWRSATLDLTQRLLRETPVVQEARVDAIARESQVASVT